MSGSPHQEHILVIKHGALGDIILATGPFQAIRNKHPNAHITLLTTQAFAGLVKDAPYFHEIWIDSRPKLWHFSRFFALKRQLRSHRFDWVYDLQTSTRSTGYFNLLATPKPNYSGLHHKGSHPHNTPERTRLHTIDRQKQQLAIAGIDEVPPPNIDWLKEDHPVIQSADHPLVLLVPGGSAHRPEKRWPDECYVELAQKLIMKGYLPVLIGAGAEADLLAGIETRIMHHTLRALPFAPVNLCNQTSFAQIAQLARHAVHAIGNDTGPMHIIAAAGCNSTIIFNTSASNPDLCAPRGDHVTILKTETMAQTGVDAVFKTITAAVTKA